MVGRGHSELAGYKNKMSKLRKPCSHSSMMGDVEMGMGARGWGGWMGGNDCANKGNPPTQELAPRGNESHHWIQESPINKYFASYNML